MSIVKYRNGNYDVFLSLDDGTKIRKNNLDHFTPEFPEAMDIKISNRCDMLCSQCHECSTPNGALADIMSESFIDTLRPWTELALGGGNVFEHPDLVPFLVKCKNKHLIPNITIHQKHFMERLEFVDFLIKSNLIYGLGVSLATPSEAFIKAVGKHSNAVVHVINGIVSVDDLKKLANHDLKILILGYKTKGRGVTYRDINGDAIKEKQNELRSELPKIIDKGWFKAVSFDNLAIEQLDVKSIVGDKWDEFYMGNDGFATMYVDMVKREFAVSSTSEERFPMLPTIDEMFRVVRTS